MPPRLGANSLPPDLLTPHLQRALDRPPCLQSSIHPYLHTSTSTRLQRASGGIRFAHLLHRSSRSLESTGQQRASRALEANAYTAAARLQRPRPPCLQTSIPPCFHVCTTATCLHTSRVSELLIPRRHLASRYLRVAKSTRRPRSSGAPYFHTVTALRIDAWEPDGQLPFGTSSSPQLSLEF